jgi:sarcosine oxidase
MPSTYDVIVLGVGGFGSSALYHLARRGLRVVGLEQFGIAHDRGSSHGETRIIRMAYFEHPDYVPLLVRAYELWSELQQRAGRELLNLCGLLLAGPPEGEAVAGAKLAARIHHLPLEELDLATACKRFSGFHFRDDFAAVFEADAGFLHVEECVLAHIEQAVEQGAVIKTEERVLAWSSDGKTVRVRTTHEEYQAARLVITAGAWAGRVLSDLNIPLEVVRKPVFWHPVKAPVYDFAAGAPAYLFEMAEGQFYGFPSLDGKSLKVAEHTGGKPVADPLTVDRAVHEEDVRPIRGFLAEAMPDVDLQAADHSVCMYTLTPDRHFIVDRHPQFANVAIGAGFSGHGFKFTSVIGEALADLVVDGRTAHPIGFLSLNRSALRRTV